MEALGSAKSFDRFAKHIENRQLISVNLSGFGNSEQDIPDYWRYLQAKYLKEFLFEKISGIKKSIDLQEIFANCTANSELLLFE